METTTQDTAAAVVVTDDELAVLAAASRVLQAMGDRQLDLPNTRGVGRYLRSVEYAERAIFDAMVAAKVYADASVTDAQLGL